MPVFCEYLGGTLVPFSTSLDPESLVGAPGVSTTCSLGAVGFVDADMLPFGTSPTSSGSMVLSSKGVKELILRVKPPLHWY